MSDLTIPKHRHLFQVCGGRTGLAPIPTAARTPDSLTSSYLTPRPRTKKRNGCGSTVSSASSSRTTRLPSLPRYGPAQQVALRARPQSPQQNPGTLVLPDGETCVPGNGWFSGSALYPPSPNPPTLLHLSVFQAKQVLLENSLHCKSRGARAGCGPMLREEMPPRK